MTPAQGTASARAGVTAKSADVFISYGRADVGVAERLEALLAGPPHNLVVWRDKQRLLAGENIHEVINDALLAAKSVVTLWSAASAASDWVRHETAIAVGHRKTAMLALAGFDYAGLPSTYRHLNCSDADAILADPAPLVQRIRAIMAAPRGGASRPKVGIRQLPLAPNAFVARSEELAGLHQAWAGAETNVHALIAAGGTGKTSLVQAFLDQLAKVGWGGAETVFAFSFDSQGTDEKRQGSSDRFFSEALSFFGENPQDHDSVRKRAHRLAEIAATKRALIVLDGIEPMQIPRGDELHGRLRDDALADFLVTVARENAGLCVVTSRLPLPDLAGIDAGLVTQVRLPNLPLADAVAMLRGFGLAFPPDELAKLATDFGAGAAAHGPGDEPGIRCHAKAIALIGAFIKRRFAGAGHAPAIQEVRGAFAMPDEAFLGGDLEALKEEPGYAVYKMIRRYEILYEDRAEALKKALVATAPGRQLLLLRVMGLFDRPATWGAFEAVLAAPAIAGLTDRLAEVTPGEWQAAVAALREDGLLNPSPDNRTVLGPGHVLDAHPLVREYFGRRLRVVAP